MKKHKICIVGGGLTGLITAHVLNEKGLDIDLIIENTKLKTKDTRVTAISEKKFEFIKSSLKKIDLKLFYAVQKIDLFLENNKQIKKFLNFNEKKNLMLFFENNLIKEHLTKLLKKSKIKVQKKTIKSVDPEESKVITNLSFRTYDLIILCLGSKSPIYERVSGNRAIRKDYREHSITCSVRHELKKIGAMQFFLKEGPLAILPYKKDKFSVVWSVEDQYFSKNKKNLHTYLRTKLSSLLKTNKLILGNIQSYPLNLLIKKDYYKKNTIILGDGLHVFHPLAGQGFNLILRDIKKLKELISTNLKLGLPIKNSNILKDLSKNRKPENFFIGLGIDTTRRFFKHSRYFNPIKETILNQFSKSEFLKKISKRVANIGLNQ